MTTGALTTPSASSFPNPNLPPSAQAWARAVMQRVAQLEDQGVTQGSKARDTNKTLIETLRRSATGADPRIYQPSFIQSRQDITGSANFSIYSSADQTNYRLQNTALVLQPDVIHGVAHQDDDDPSGNTGAMSLALGGMFFDLSGHPVNGSSDPETQFIEAGFDTVTRAPYLRLMGADYTAGGGGGTTASDLPASATTGQVLTWNGSAWVAEDLPADNDPAELPATATTGQILEWNGTAWVAADPPAQTSGWTRQTVTYTTASLAAATSEVGLVQLAPGYRIYRVQLSGPGRVRLYDTVAHRDNDRTRDTTTTIDRTTDTGLMLDMALSTVLAMTCAPLVDGVNFETGSGVPITVDNLGSAAAAITVTLTFVRTE